MIAIATKLAKGSQRICGSAASANRAKMGMVQSMAVETFGVVDVEEPKYEVVLKRDGGPVHYEIRRYGKRCINIPLLFFAGW